ncbi:MAG: T9SS C-terminal target domain-containing protein, partial [candidate division Zixibacteria bacterium]|nr:T9SS C-terminal target domain-containing protein [candidate division Zixibacteria bacterium]
MKRKLLALLLTMLPTLAFGQLSDNGKPVKLVTDADISANRTFFNDTVYNLSGFVYVESGLTLTIEPGTIIKGNPGQ